MVKCYKTKNLDSYYLEMGATEGFLKGEIKTLVDKLRDKEEEIKKLKSDLSLVIKERDDNIEQNKKLKSDNEYRTKIARIATQEEKTIAEETIQDLVKRIKELNERIRFLEQCLDNKEKVNKSLREENRKLRERIKELEK